MCIIYFRLRACKWRQDSRSGTKHTDDVTDSDNYVSIIASEDEFILGSEHHISENDDGNDSNTDSCREFSPGGPWFLITGPDLGLCSIPFVAAAVPKVSLTRTAKPVDFAKLFITEDFVSDIVTETNKYGDEWIRRNQTQLRNSPRSSIHTWQNGGHTTIGEIYTFLAVLLNMGLVKKPTLSDYWDISHPSQSTPWFPYQFKRERFQLLLKFLHFADNRCLPSKHDPHYKLYKVQPVIDHFKNCFKKYFRPGRNITVESSFSEYRENVNGKCSHFSIKIWRLCDVETGYISAFTVLKENNVHNSVSEELGRHLIMKLLQENELLFHGHHLRLDKELCTPKLLLDLYDKQTIATGIAKNHKHLPQKCLDGDLKDKESREWRQGPVLCVTYRDEAKQQTLLSTAACAGYDDDVTKNGKCIKKPKILSEYNSVCCPVSQKDIDLHDLMCDKRTTRWTTMVMLSLIGSAMQNAYLLYTRHTSDIHKLTRRQFMISVIEALASRSTNRSENTLKKTCKRKVGSTLSNSPKPKAPLTQKTYEKSHIQNDSAVESQKSVVTPPTCASDVEVSQNSDDIITQEINKKTAQNISQKCNATPVTGTKVNKISSLKKNSNMISRKFINQLNKMPQKGHSAVRVKNNRRMVCTGDHEKVVRTRLMCSTCKIGICFHCFPQHLQEFIG